MLQLLAPAIFVNAFWFSIPFLGFVSLVFLKKTRWVYAPLRIAISELLGQHIFVIAFLSTVCGFGLFAPISFIFYAIHAPVKVLVIGYCLLIIAGFIYFLSMLFKELFKVQQYDFFKFSGQVTIVKIISILLIAILVADFSIALYLRSHALMDTDTYYHMTRVLEMSASGFFNINSGFYTGVFDASYHANLIYLMYTIPVRIFNLDPLTVWSYSYGFFRLIQWLAIFTLAYSVCNWWIKITNDKLLYASLSTILAISLFSFHFFIAPYPNQIAVAWLIAFVMSVMYYSARSNRVGIFTMALAGLLISATHPTYAMVATMFISFFALLMAMKNEGTLREKIRKTYEYLIPVPLLMIAPIITKTFPSNPTDTQLSIGDSSTWDFWGFSMSNPLELSGMLPVQWLAFILGCLGLIYLILKTKNGSNGKLIVLAVVLFPLIILYVPVVFTLLKVILPIWVLDRFTAMNVFSFILPFFGIMCGLHALYNLIGAINLNNIFSSKLTRMGMLSGVVCLTAGVAALATIPQLVQYDNLNNYAYDSTERFRKDLVNVIPPESRILSDPLLSYTLPAVIPVDVIAVASGHSTMMADTKNRILCQEYLLNTMDSLSLTATGVDFVVLPTYDPQFIARQRMADENLQLMRVFKSADYSIYKFNNVQVKDGAAESAPFKSCIEYQRREATQL